MQTLITFWPSADATKTWQHEEMTAPPAVGTRILHANEAYVVTDVWFIEPKRGPVDYGWNVFLSPSPEAMNQLRAVDPAYYA